MLERNTLGTYRAAQAQQQRDDLILKNLHLVRHTVSRILAQLPPGVDVENLEAAGTLGLVEAATKYDASRGAKFETFAAYRIRGAVYDELRRNSILPQQQLERAALIQQAYTVLPQPVTLEALAAHTKLSMEDITDCLAALRVSRMISWEYLSEVKQVQVADKESVSTADREDQVQSLAQAITRLSEKERLVVTMYYLEEMRLKEIGKVLNLSESRVSRLLNAAIFNLGEWMRQEET